jgi:Cu2+-exporting ATPase
MKAIDPRQRDQHGLMHGATHSDKASGGMTSDEHVEHDMNAKGHDMGAAGHDQHAGHSVAMLRDKFWLTLALTIPDEKPLFGHVPEFHSPRDARRPIKRPGP